MQIGIAGLGRMGSAVAARLMEVRHTVTVWNRNADKAKPLTDAGAYTLSASRYGTYDQAGGVWEWTDSLVGSERIMRGGSWNDNQGSLSASYRQFYNVSFDNEHVGIRVAVAAAPEPGVLSLALVGISGLLLSRRCRPVV